jgi:RHS repeat-associated protein
VVSRVVTRHYTDGSDNPGRVDADGVGPFPGSGTRFVAGVDGLLGAEVSGDGSVQVVIANVHGDVVTSVDIPAGVGEGTPAASIGSWSDYTENGVPIDGTAGAATGAATGVGSSVASAGAGGASSSSGASASGVGYGWLGAHERATLGAGLVLMGARLYNPATGWFTGPDPVYGGNDTAYTYPTDPVNDQDLDGLKGKKGRWGVRRWLIGKWKKPRHVNGDFYLRKGRPAIHWRDGSSTPRRIEWDRHNKWHYNRHDGHHGSVRQGYREYRSYRKSRRRSRFRGFRSPRWGNLGVLMPHPCRSGIPMSYCRLRNREMA